MITNPSLKILYIFNGIFVLAAGLLGPLYAVFVETIDTNVLSVSITWAVFWLSATLFMVVVSKKGDSIKKKHRLLMAGFGIRAIAWFLFIFVSNLWFLAIIQILLGLGEALGTPSFNSLFAEHLDKGRHIHEYSNWSIINNISIAVGTILGGLIVTAFGFSTLFFLMGVLGFISFFGVMIQSNKLESATK